MNNFKNTDEIVFTQKAANKVYELIADELDKNLNLRLRIIGGGCSGFQYAFSFDTNINEGDTIIERTVIIDDKQEFNVKLVIDYLSVEYLLGATVDYKDELSGSHFVIQNPRAKGTCGCGSSFTLDDE